MNIIAKLLHVAELCRVRLKHAIGVALPFPASVQVDINLAEFIEAELYQHIAILFNVSLSNSFSIVIPAPPTHGRSGCERQFFPCLTEER